MKTWLLFLSGGAWLGAVSYGMFALLTYSNTPGENAGEAPNNWPVQSALRFEPGKPRLVMFIHPKCPCTRASLNELAGLMAHCQGLVETTVVIIRPLGADAAWEKTDLRRRAEAIPGVTTQVDDGGREARLFRATTSGMIVLYDEGGRLQFSGGITSARGHEGDNAGLLDIDDLLHGRAVSQKQTLVFGCSLLAPRPSSVSLSPCKQ